MFPQPSGSGGERGQVSVVEVNGEIQHVAVSSASNDQTLVGSVLRRAGLHADVLLPAAAAAVAGVVDLSTSLSAAAALAHGRTVAAASSVALRRPVSWSERCVRFVRALLDDDDDRGDDDDGVGEGDDDHDDHVAADSHPVSKQPRSSSVWRLLRRSVNAALYFVHVRVPPIELLVPRALAPRPRAVVRALAWHPRLAVLAVATSDAVLFYNVRSGRVEQVALTHDLQHNVLDLRWRPFDDATLAVACGAGVCVWHVEFDAPSGVVSTAWMRCLRAHGHAPVSSLAWAPDGVLLATGSPNDSSVMLWDVDLNGKCTPLGAAAPLQGVTMVRWAPDGSMLFAATPSAFGVYRVAERWQLERWAKCGGGVLAACWLPDSSALLLACAGETRDAPATLTALRFARQGGSAVMTLPLAPTTVTLADGRQWRVFGGDVCDMAVNDTAERLAITFTPKRVARHAAVRENSASLVALYAVTTRPHISVLPLGAARLFGASATNAWRVAFTPQSNAVSRELLAVEHTAADAASVHATVLAVSGEDGRIALLPCVPHSRKHVTQQQQQQQQPVLRQSATPLVKQR